MGSRGLAPSCCLPHWGREGVTLAISTPAQKTRGISTKPFINEGKQDFFTRYWVISLWHVGGR
jgi:hypothetical protein